MCALGVQEASETYASAMRNVLPAGPGVCSVCHCFLEEGWARCFKCGQLHPGPLDLVVPITYSEHLGQMHTALRSYKSGWQEEQKYAGIRLQAILWRFLDGHERCLTEHLGLDGFEVVTSVPSSTRRRDEANKLRPIVRSCGPVRDRFEQLLQPSVDAADTREYDPGRYVPDRELNGENVLLIDDTWTTGAHAQSAAAALKAAGAGAVALVVIGRHVNPDWKIGERTSKEMLAQLPFEFDWSRCAIENPERR